MKKLNAVVLFYIFVVFKDKKHAKAKINNSRTNIDAEKALLLTENIIKKNMMVLEKQLIDLLYEYLLLINETKKDLQKIWFNIAFTNEKMSIFLKSIMNLAYRDENKKIRIIYIQTNELCSYINDLLNSIDIIAKKSYNYDNIKLQIKTCLKILQRIKLEFFDDFKITLFENDGDVKEFYKNARFILKCIFLIKIETDALFKTETKGKIILSNKYNILYDTLKIYIGKIENNIINIKKSVFNTNAIVIFEDLVCKAYFKKHDDFYEVLKLLFFHLYGIDKRMIDCKYILKLKSLYKDFYSQAKHFNIGDFLETSEYIVTFRS